MKQVECNKCGKVFEIEGEWGYCPFCENDNVEVDSYKTLTDEYYKQDICVDCARCKFYHPLFTQGECEYYNQWCELQKVIKLLKDKNNYYEFVNEKTETIDVDKALKMAKELI